MRKRSNWRSVLLIPLVLMGGATYAASCKYTIGNDWDAGYGVSITVTNDTAQTIDGWSVTWTYANSTVGQIWDAKLQGTNPYTASDLGYNSKIEPNKSVSFGFNASKNTSGAAAETPVLGGICSTAPPVNTPPVANGTATPTRGTVPFDVALDASLSTDADADTLTYLWDFGGGETANTVTATRRYTSAGSFPVKLTVSDGKASSVKNFTITAEAVNADPLAYTLDATASSLHFVSTKKTHVIEAHTFNTLSGGITTAGAASFKVNLDSVNTANTTRDGRMRSMLFETGTFTEATASVTVDLTALDNLAVGATQRQTLAATLDLHGVVVPLTADVDVSKVSANKLIVANASPILLSAGDYNLTVGVDSLRDIANLSVISYAVPVNFILVFNKP